MAEVDAGRDEWMRRTGPFYRLVVAAQAQTDLPIAATLVPSDADRREAVGWMPLVGLALALLLAFVAVVLREIGLAPVALAAVVAVLIAGSGGVAFERALSSLPWLQRIARDPGAAFALAFVAALVLRLGLLAGVRDDGIAGAILVAVLASRGVLAGALLLGRDGDGGDESPWIAFAVSAAVALGVVGLTAGLAGFAILAATAPLAVAGGWWCRGTSDDVLRERARAIALTAEIAAWLALAAALPA